MVTVSVGAFVVADAGNARIKKSGAGWLFPTPDFSISILVSFQRITPFVPVAYAWGSLGSLE